MILSFDEIYEKYSNQLITKDRFNDLIHIAYMNVHEGVNIDDKQNVQDFDEEDLKLKVEIIRLIKENNPLNYIQPDELYVFESGLQNAVDDLERSYHEYDIYKCKKCNKIMTQALELECGCSVCTKCLTRHNGKQYSRRQSTLNTPMTIHSQYADQEANNPQKTVQCPVCNQQIYYIKQLHQINQFTRQLRYCCKYSGCTRVDTYQDLLKHMQTCRFGYEELQKGLGGYYQRILQYKDQEIARLKRQINEYSQQLRLQMTELRISKMFNTEIRKELEESKVQSLACKFSASPTTDITLSTCETKSNQSDNLLLKSAGNSDDLMEKNVLSNHIAQLKETIGESSVVTSAMCDKPDTAQTPSSGHTKLKEAFIATQQQETSDKNLQNSIGNDFSLCKMHYIEYVPQMDVMEQSNMRMSFLNNSSLAMSQQANIKPKPVSNLYTQLKYENNKLKEELTRVKNQLVSNLNSSVFNQSSKKQPKVIEYPANYVGQLDYDLTVITLLRYIFYADEYDGGRLQTLCQQQRQLLLNGLNYNNTNIQLKYQYLVQFISGIYYYYSRGSESTAQFLKIEELMSKTIDEQHIDQYATPIKLIYQMMCKRKENSKEFNKIELGGFIMRNEFGIEARLSMLEYIQNLKMQLKMTQEQLAKQ